MDSIFCQYCGTPNNVDARFCRVCGKQFTAAPQPPTPQQPVVSPQYPPTGGYPQQPVYPTQQPAAPQPVYQVPQPIQPAPQQPSIPLTPAAPVKKKKWKTLLLGSILGLVGVCAVFLGYVLIFTQPIQNTANDFLTALQHNDYPVAFSMMSAETQSLVGSAENLKAFAEANGYSFVSWKGGSVKRNSGNPPTGIKMADITHSDGSTETMEIDLKTGLGAVWQITDFGNSKNFLSTTFYVQNVTNGFLFNLMNQDYASAFNMMSSSVQGQLGSADGLASFCASNGYVFSAINGGSISFIPGTPPQGVGTANVTSDNGTFTLEVDSEQGEDGVWQVIGFGSPAN